MNVITQTGGRYSWECHDCGVASHLYDTFAEAVAGYEAHLERDAAWIAAEEAGQDRAEAFEEHIAQLRMK